MADFMTMIASPNFWIIALLVVLLILEIIDMGIGSKFTNTLFDKNLRDLRTLGSSYMTNYSPKNHTALQSKVRSGEATPKEVKAYLRYEEIYKNLKNKAVVDRNAVTAGNYDFQEDISALTNDQFSYKMHNQ